MTLRSFLLYFSYLHSFQNGVTLLPSCVFIALYTCLCLSVYHNICNDFFMCLSLLCLWAVWGHRPSLIVYHKTTQLQTYWNFICSQKTSFFSVLGTLFLLVLPATLTLTLSLFFFPDSFFLFGFQLKCKVLKETITFAFLNHPHDINLYFFKRFYLNLYFFPSIFH